MQTISKEREELNKKCYIVTYAQINIVMNITMSSLISFLDNLSKYLNNCLSERKNSIFKTINYKSYTTFFSDKQLSRHRKLNIEEVTKLFLNISRAISE